MKSSKRSDIKPFLVMDLLNKANEYQAEGRDIIHMEAGQPGTPAPKRVRDVAKEAIDETLIGYQASLGMPVLRARIAQHYEDAYGVEIAPERIVITTGSSAGFVLSFLSLFDDGDRIGMGAPYYPAYPNIISSLGYTPVILNTDKTTNFQVTVDLLSQQTEKLDGLMVASPANPTGSMLSSKELERLVHYCADNSIKFISDEIYHGIVYGEGAHSALEFSDEVVVVNSFSKYFCMTGWRVGWLVIPPSLVRPIERLSSNLYISVPTLSQIAAVSAFDARDELEGNVAQYKKNRDYLMAELPKIGLTEIASPDGAFYLYVDISHLASDSVAFCEQLLEETGVAVTPGADFDVGARAAKIRFSYAGKFTDMEETIKRLGKWLAK